MYIEYYSEDPDYFGENEVHPKSNSYYYDGSQVYQGGYGRIVSGQDPCYYANMRNQQRAAQNPFQTSSRRFMYQDQQPLAPVAPQPIPQPQTYGDPNYFNQDPMFYGNGVRDPQYFGYYQPDPNMSRRYGSTPYTPRAYQAYQAPQPTPQPAPQPPQGLNTNLFTQQRGYSNPINQNMPQQIPQRQLLRVSCPQQINGFGANKYTTPRMPSDPNIDWSALANLDSMNNQGYANSYGGYGQERIIPAAPTRKDADWYEIACQNFGR